MWADDRWGDWSIGDASGPVHIINESAIFREDGIEVRVGSREGLEVVHKPTDFWEGVSLEFRHNSPGFSYAASAVNDLLIDYIGHDQTDAKGGAQQDHHRGVERAQLLPGFIVLCGRRGRSGNIGLVHKAYLPGVLFAAGAAGLGPGALTPTGVRIGSMAGLCWLYSSASLASELTKF